MKRLWEVIDREMRREQLTARQMAMKLQMDPAQLSRLRTGQLRDLSAESLGHLLDGLGRTRALRSELLAAYLHDKLEGCGAATLKTAEEAASESVAREKASTYGAHSAPGVADICLRSGLSRRVAGAIEELASLALENRRLQVLLVSLADYARKN